LNHGDIFAENGVPGLLSPDAFSIAWTQYQQFMVDRLNTITSGFPEANFQPKDIVLQHARSPATASLFNHASMAFNNQFFFNGLAPISKPLSNYRALESSFLKTYGSIATLRSTMLGTANAMFGPGHVWLVWASGVGASGNSDGWRILTTYLAGTPFAEAGYRTQDQDMNTASNSVGAFGGLSKAGRRDAAMPPGSAKVVPVLCVSTWQHVYIRDYGVAPHKDEITGESKGGKKEYLEKWWDAIDWHQVNSNAPPLALSNRSFRS